VQRLGQLALTLSVDALRRTPQNLQALHHREMAIDQLGEHIRDFIGRMNRAQLPTPVADALAPMLRALQHFEEVADLAVSGSVPEPLVQADLLVLRDNFLRVVTAVMAEADVAMPTFLVERLDQVNAEQNRVYESLKAGLLKAAAQGQISLHQMDAHIQDIGRMHRNVERAVKAAHRLAPLRLLIAY
jgi:Na+/phosphate symporter